MINCQAQVHIQPTVPYSLGMYFVAKHKHNPPTHNPYMYMYMYNVGVEFFKFHLKGIIKSLNVVSLHVSVSLS